MTPYSLLDPLHIPPGGWSYIQSETGLKVQGGDFYHLCQNVRRHRQLNKLRTDNLIAEVEAQICQNLREDARILFCRETNPSVKTLKKIAFDDVKHFLKTLTHLKKFVPQAEAERRAAICASCPLNYPISGCSRCRNLPALIFGVVGKRSTSMNDKLGGCGVCGCGLAAAVHVPLESFPIEPKYDFPEWCWHRG
jgi:hypothetical protein